MEHHPPQQRIISTPQCIEDELDASSGATEMLFGPGNIIAAKVWGEDKGNNRVFCVHGWLDNAATWTGLVPYLKNDFYLVCPDMAGHGLSYHRGKYNSYHMMEYVPDCIMVLQQLGWESFTLIGHSMGVFVVTVLASIMPTKVKGLVMIEGLSAIYVGDYVTSLQNALFKNVKFRYDAKQPKVYASLDDAIEARCTPENNFSLSREGSRALVLRGARWVPDIQTGKPTGQVQFLHDQALRYHTILRLHQEHVLSILSAIQCPVLLILGEKGIHTAYTATEAGRKEMNQRKESIRHLSEIFVPGEGHHVHLEAPEKIQQRLREFLTLTQHSHPETTYNPHHNYRFPNKATHTHTHHTNTHTHHTHTTSHENHKAKL